MNNNQQSTDNSQQSTSSQQPSASAQLSVWQGTWALIRYRPGMFLAQCGGMAVYVFTMRGVPGWLQKLFFDRLTGETQVTFDLCADFDALVAVEASRMVLNIVGGMERGQSAAGRTGAAAQKRGAKHLAQAGGAAAARPHRRRAQPAGSMIWLILAIFPPGFRRLSGMGRLPCLR